MIDVNSGVLMLDREHIKKYGVNAAVVLSLIIKKSNESGGKPFYMFKDSCRHLLYKKGDSISELTAMSTREIDTAIQKISVKIKKNSDKLFNGGINQMPVIYWIDAARVTWYILDSKNI